MLDHRIGDLHFLSYELFEPVRNVINIVTTREGGRGSGEFAALNLALHVGEDPDVTLENRALVAMGMGFEPESLTVAEQVHGSVIAAVSTAERGRGAVFTDDAISATDAMITNAPDVPLMILVADCVAISLYDPRHRAIGLVHAGWRGTLGRIAEKAVAQMKQTYQTEPADLLVGLSPAISPGEYEVGDEVHDAFVEAFGRREARRFIQEDMNGVCYLDLWTANARQLEGAGVKPAQIANSEICTVLDPKRFYSHRRDAGRTGRFAAVMMIVGSGDRSY